MTARNAPTNRRTVARANAAFTWVGFLGVAIRNLREEKGLTQRQLAARMRPPIDREHVSTLECGHYWPSMERLASVAIALDVPAHELVLKAERWAELDASAGDA